MNQTMIAPRASAESAQDTDFARLFRNEPHLVTLEHGETLLEQGSSASRHLYVVLSGDVSIEVDGREIGRETEGGILGELSLVDDGPASASVVARGETRLAAIDESRFRYLVQEHPYFALAVMRVMCRRLRDSHAG